MERKEDYGAPTLFSNPVSIGILFALLSERAFTGLCYFGGDL